MNATENFVSFNTFFNAVSVVDHECHRPKDSQPCRLAKVMGRSWLSFVYEGRWTGMMKSDGTWARYTNVPPRDCELSKLLKTKSDKTRLVDLALSSCSNGG